MERILVAKDGTQENLLKAISDVAKAGVMAKTAKDAEIPMEGLYKTLQPNGNLLLNGSVQILGKKLLIGGEGGGIWFAPATGEVASIDESGADWIPVTAKLSVNKPGTLLFPLPKTLSAGTYRIVLKTRCTSNLKYERKELVSTVSDALVIK